MCVKWFRSFLGLLLALPSLCFANKSLLPIHQWVTSSGARVLYVKETELPIVDIQVAFDAGSARDGAKPGLARMTNEALISGTQTKNANQIASAFDDVGANFSAAANRDMAIVALRSLSERQFFEPAFAAFVDVLSHPSFPKNEFARIQKQTLNALDEQEESPGAIAVKAFYNNLFKDNPYGHPIYGTKASITQLVDKDLHDFYKAYYQAQNALIAIVGNVDEAQAKALAEKLSSQLGKGQKLPKWSSVSIDSKAQFEHVPFPSSQTHVLIGQIGIDRKDPGYFPIVVGNYIFGGGTLTSRLFDEVREKRGLAYTVRSQFSAMKERGPFIIELQTRNKEANNAIKVANDTLSRFIKEGPSQEELVAAKKNLTQGFILKLASNSAIIGQLVNIGFYQLPLNYLDTYQENISKVSNLQIRTVFQQLVHPENMLTITVGDQSGKT